MTSPDRIAQRARALHLEASRQLDPAMAGRLRAARRAALEAAQAPAHPLLRRTLLPAGAFAVLALAALMIWPASHPPAPHAASIAASDADGDLPPDPDDADPGLYQDMDFYGWLADNDGNGSTTSR